MQIPEDLKQEYADAKNSHGHYFAKLVIQLIERIASLEAALRDEQKAHMEITSALSAVGVETDDGTSVSTAKNAAKELAQARAEIAEWSKEGARRSRIIDERTAERDLATVEIDDWKKEASGQCRAAQQLAEGVVKLTDERDSLRSQLEALETVLEELRNFYCNRECETMPDHDELCKKASELLAARREGK